MVTADEALQLWLDRFIAPDSHPLKKIFYTQAADFIKEYFQLISTEILNDSNYKRLEEFIFSLPSDKK